MRTGGFARIAVESEVDCRLLVACADVDEERRPAMRADELDIDEAVVECVTWANLHRVRSAARHGLPPVIAEGSDFPRAMSAGDTTRLRQPEAAVPAVGDLRIRHPVTAVDLV